MKQKVLLGIIIVILIILAVFWYVRRPAQAPTSPTDTTTDSYSPGDPPANTSNDTPTAANSVVVTGQSAGGSVVIDQLTLSESGFVVIHEDSNGRPGKIIGSSKLLSAGSKTDLVINVATKPGMTYYAMLHLDDGDGKFNAQTDLPIAGGTVMTKFTTAK